jgi:NADPH2:quinone reductase
MKAIRLSAHGGAEVLRLEDIPEPRLAPGEALVDVEVAGVNFIDIYQRTGLYKIPLPATLGQEAAGVVAATAPDVREVKVGDRVAYAAVLGAYAERAAVAAARLVRVPDAISTRQAAAAMLQGMTAHYLTCSTYPLKPGDTCLVHAAAGGVGQLLCQLARMRGARVIGTVSSEEKARLARAAGADHTIDYTKQDFAAEVGKITGGKGVQVVYDSVGKTTFDKSLEVLAPRGLLALFGQSSGPVAPIDPQILNQRGSLFLTRPSLGHYMLDRAELTWRAGELFDWIASGRLRLTIARELPLAEAAQAQRDLEGRKTTGKILLLNKSRS